VQINDFCPEKQINSPDGFYAAGSVKVHDNFLLVFFGKMKNIVKEMTMIIKQQGKL
jgi:hypothetical protein